MAEEMIHLGTHSVLHKVRFALGHLLSRMTPFFSRGSRRQTLGNQVGACTRPHFPEPQVAPETWVFFRR